MAKMSKKCVRMWTSSTSRPHSNPIMKKSVYAVQMKKKNKKQRIRIFTYPATLFQYDYLTGYCWLKQALHKGKSLTITLKSSRFKYPNESAPICSQISSFVCLEAIRR